MKTVYHSAMNKLPFHENFEEKVVSLLKEGKQPSRLSVLSKISLPTRRLIGITAAAACLALLVVFISPFFQNSPMKLPHSSGDVSVRTIKNPDLKEQSIPQPSSLTEEELFSRSSSIFSGTVKQIETLELVVGHEVFYRSLATVIPEYVWKGSECAGSSVQILLPYAIDDSTGTDTVLFKLRKGMRCIFLAQDLTEEMHITNGNHTLALMDIASYGLSDDRCAFLDTNTGIIYEKDAFPSLKDNPTYDDVCAYITAMVGNTPSAKAAETTDILGTTTLSEQLVSPITTNQQTQGNTNSTTSNTTGNSNSHRSSTSTIKHNQIISPYGGYSGNISNCGIAVQSGDWIYYTNSSDECCLYKIRTDGSGKTKLSSSMSSHIQVQGDWVFFMSTFSLSKIHTDGTNEQAVSHEFTYYYAIDSDWVYYFTEPMQPLMQINRVKIDGSSPGYVDNFSGSGISKIVPVGNWIYLLRFTQEQNPIRRVNAGSFTNEETVGTTISGSETGGYILAVQNGWVYYTCLDSTKIMRCKPDGSERSAVISDCLLTGYFNVDEKSIYYTKESDKQLWKTDLKGNNPKKITDLDMSESYSIRCICLTKDYVYFDYYYSPTSGMSPLPSVKHTHYRYSKSRQVTEPVN